MYVCTRTQRSSQLSTESMKPALVVFLHEHARSHARRSVVRSTAEQLLHLLRAEGLGVSARTAETQMSELWAARCVVARLAAGAADARSAAESARGRSEAHRLVPASARWSAALSPTSDMWLSSRRVRAAARRLHCRLLGAGGWPRAAGSLGSLAGPCGTSRHRGARRRGAASFTWLISEWRPASCLRAGRDGHGVSPRTFQRQRPTRPRRCRLSRAVWVNDHGHGGLRPVPPPRV